MKKKHYDVPLPVALIFLLVWFLGFVFVTDVWRLALPNGDPDTITNSEYGFSVEYPSNWSAQVYGEHGLKGADHIKLGITRSPIFDSFAIVVNYQSAIEPALEDVVAWGNDLNSRFRSTRDSIEEYEEFGLQKETLNEQPIARLRYRSREMMYEDVYIDRDNDMIIITIQAPQEDFENYLEEFEAIVASFRPLQ